MIGALWSGLRFVASHASVQDVPLAPLPDGPSPTRVLLTGAAGEVAGLLWPRIVTSSPNWRCVDRRPVPDRRSLPTGQVERCEQELSTVDSILPLLGGVDAVVHLAGQARAADDEQHERHNVQLMRSLLEAMERAGVGRLIMASSMHVLGGYPRTTRLTPETSPRPSGPYGESKARAESLVQAAARRFPLQAFILRMGAVRNDAGDAEPGNWLATDDLARLIDRALRVDAPGVTTVHAVTPHAGDDLGQARVAALLGTRWRSDAPSYDQEMRRLRKWFGDDRVARRYRGGVFRSRGW